MKKRPRKKKISFYIKELMWPSMGWKRAAKYLGVRMMRLSATSDAVPRGFACGVAASFFPVFGVHAILAVLMALAIRANAVAAALGTLVFPPVILPLVFSLDYIVGAHILGWFGLSYESAAQTHAMPTNAQAHHLGFMAHLSEYLLPAFTGSVLFMVLVWPAAYMAIHKAINLIRRHYKAKKRT